MDSGSFLANLGEGLAARLEPDALGVVEDFMDTEPITAGPNDAIGHLARRMVEDRVHRIIIIDNQRHVVGACRGTQPAAGHGNVIADQDVVDGDPHEPRQGCGPARENAESTAHTSQRGPLGQSPEPRRPHRGVEVAGQHERPRQSADQVRDLFELIVAESKRCRQQRRLRVGAHDRQRLTINDDPQTDHHPPLPR